MKGIHTEIEIRASAEWEWSILSSASDRPDAVHHDLARSLAGSRGQEIAGAMPDSQRRSWAWVARTDLFDQSTMICIAAPIRSGRCVALVTCVFVC
jgi:hypothetical protein